jgi:hypothetical protein
VDSDCNGLSDYDADGDGDDSDQHGGTDCDDIDANIYVGATEIPEDGIDQDCDGGDIYGDDDGDGFAEDEGDCDDTTSAIGPGVAEIWYDGVDQDCDGLSDYDQDLDGQDSSDYGGSDCNDTDITTIGDADGDGFSACVDDCNDDPNNGGASINPSATEIFYDGVDSDCSGDSDYDADGDGEDSDQYGGGDCDDTDAGIYVGATDIFYDGVDADCAGNSDYDQDGDGEDADTHNGLDCDDGDALINTSATDVWYDGVDSNCDGMSDYDMDMDGYDSDAHGGSDCDEDAGSINPGATEIFYDGLDSDCSGGSDYDADGDGDDSDQYGGDDCDDTDSQLSSLSSEIWYDGVFQNCLTVSDYDQDGDGEDSDTHGGDDCDDIDSAINTFADDTVVNGIDDNCNGVVDEGSFLGIGALFAGDLIITELMQNPSAVPDSSGEWFEIFNDSGVGLNLDGLGIMDDGSNDFTVTGAVYISAGEYVVFGPNEDFTTNGGVNVDYAYGSDMALSNGADELYIYNDSDFIDMIEWDGGATFPDPTGASMTLSPGLDATDNDDGFNWCEGTSPYGEGDLGTPGAENDTCPTPLSWTNDVLPILQSYSCTGCHSGQLSSLSTLLNVQAGDYSGSNSVANMPWITPGDPSLSYLFQ